MALEIEGFIHKLESEAKNRKFNRNNNKTLTHQIYILIFETR